jgi:hypothetical protein
VREKNDGIAIYVLKEIILKEMAEKIKLSQHLFLDLVRELSDSGVSTFSFCCQKFIVHYIEINLKRNE